MGAGVEPGEAPREALYTETPLSEVVLVDARDFQLPASRGFHTLRYLDDVIGIKVEPHHGKVRPRCLGLFLNREHSPLAVKVHHPVSLRVAHPVAEDHRLTLPLDRPHGRLQQAGEGGTVEDIIPQHEADILLSDEVTPYKESLSEPLRRRLHGVEEAHPERPPVPQKSLVGGAILRCGDDEDLPDPRQHKGGDRVVDHRLIVDRQQLLGDPSRDRVETGATPAGKYYSFHRL